MDEKERLTKIIKKRLDDYQAKTGNEGTGVYEKFIPEFVDAALKYQLFKDNPDLLPTIFIQETSAGRNITRANNAINYGVADPKIQAKFAARDIITNLRASIEEIAQSGTAYSQFRTGKPLTDEELMAFARKYEPANADYPKYLLEGRQVYKDIEKEVDGGEVLGTSTPTPTTMPTASPTPTPVQVMQPRPTVAQSHQYIPDVTITNSKGETKRYIYGVDQTPYEQAKSIQQQYNKTFGGWKSMFGGLMNPKPAFSAENDQSSPSNVEAASTAFLNNPVITQKYGAKTFDFYGKGGHEGTDFRAAENSPVRGLSGWIVDFAGQGESYYGNKVVIRNPLTGESLEFAHLNDVNVKKGQVLGKDEIVGLTGKTGARPDGKGQQAHLHVNYYDASGKKKDVTALAKGAEKMAMNFPMVQDVRSALQPKKVQAAEKAPKSEMPDKTVPYFGKSQGSYQIKPGDTLSALAKQYRTTVSDFQRQNPTITNPNMIRAGETIKVPSGPTPTSKNGGYTIRSGDTLSAIAKNLGTTVNDLVRKNGIVDPNKIFTGTKLKI